MKNLIISSILIFLFSAMLSYSESADIIFKQANEHYKDKEYQKAISLYNEVLEKGYKNAAIYYNLANSYFKLDKIADAILNYERAKKLDPDNPDILFNLKIANLKIVDKINEVPKLFFIEWYEDLYSSLSSEDWAILIVISSWFTFSLLLGYFIIYSVNIRKVCFFCAIAGILIIILSSFFAYKQYTEEITKKEAIIFEPSVYVKNSPDESSTDLFILHEGLKVEILDHVDDWKKIKLADGNIGWLPANSIEVI